ncbi:putative gamma-glutamyl phosphate reductase [Neolecta irregularis DAH-3]|uniref:glutamate-5-semialdehyde dehydrogenase n=1 Tax=Neolecta irregularis (strain DAH-3) TaxID=1198029 RepID=A0A1U7LQK9_NEOID|nr:putative gamma-glutamyl phosphate reductase [Neolecta irregularis DAH-3]|eukprot:OLL24832.1 putative gamma-glutamyl phosphate reductase [Neolecta irregularis DAH-3]
MQTAKDARDAGRLLQSLPVSRRNAALQHIHNQLLHAKQEILAANTIDLQAAAAANLAAPLVARLDISCPDKFRNILQGLLDVQNLADPLGQIQSATTLDHGLHLSRVSCPIGVLLVIFEARPEVVVNITALALKSGNAAILKGGKESLHTLIAIEKAIKIALSLAEIPSNAFQLISSRDEVSELLTQDKYIDLVIPRGSNALVQQIKQNTKIPVLGHADGICSIYVHQDADIEMASSIILDSKTNYPAACNAVETLLIHSSLLTSALPQIAKPLLSSSVTLKCDPASFDVLKDLSHLVIASTEQDYNTEFLSLTLAVKTVSSLSEAIKHINAHSSNHTDCLISSSQTVASQFTSQIDSANVYWNASTRFADGFRYGFGSEVGISTCKIHARGPVGLQGLTIYKYVLKGAGHVVADYTSGKRTFLHEKDSEK